MAMALDAQPARQLLTVDELSKLVPRDELVLLDYCPVPEGWSELMGVDPALEERYIDYDATVLEVCGDEAAPDVLLYLPRIEHEERVSSEVFVEMVKGGYVARRAPR